MNSYSEFLKSLSYKQLQRERAVIAFSCKRFNGLNSEMVEYLNLCDHLLKNMEAIKKPC